MLCKPSLNKRCCLIEIINPCAQYPILLSCLVRQAGYIVDGYFMLSSATSFFTVSLNIVFRPPDPVLQSCTKLSQAGYTTDGYYMIDPDGEDEDEEPFQVYCSEMTSAL